MPHCSIPCCAFAARIPSIIAFLTAAFLAGPSAASAPPTPEALRELSIEELGRIQVTTVSKRPEAAGSTPAAIYVITNEDIRRSGATSLPEALRLAPNLLVARRNAAAYAISARGFNSFEAANKLLVLIDGRSVYTALHGGVFWDQEHVPLDNIARIEVVSGPGGALWGANAFNGVVNVVTKNAADTTGVLVDGFAGAPDQGATAQVGAALGENAAFRVYGHGVRRGETVDAMGDGRNDDWSGWQTGFRLDWSPGEYEISANGALYENDIGETDLSGRNITANVGRALGESVSAQLLAYYDWVERRSPTVVDQFESFDVEGRASLALGTHLIAFGAGYRNTDDLFAVTASPFFLQPQSEAISIANIFVSDEFPLADNLAATLGVKFEHSGFSGGEILPSAKLAWRFKESALLWASVARAVRTPSRIDRNIVGPGFLQPTTFDTEEVIAYEAGYRETFGRASLSVSLYFNDYDDLRVITTAPGGALTFGNAMNGHGYGAEIWGDYQLLDWWRVSGGLNLLYKDLELAPNATTIVIWQHQGNDPDYQLQFRSRMDLTERLKFDAILRAVDDLENPVVPGYVEADARVAYRLTDAVELSLAGRNLLDNAHPETDFADVRGEVRRSVNFGARLRF